MGKVLTYEEAKRRGLLERLAESTDDLDIDVRTTRTFSRVNMLRRYEIVQASAEAFHVQGCGPKTRRAIELLVTELGLQHGTIFTDLLKRKLSMRLTGDEPHEEDTEEELREKPTLPSKDDLAKQHEQLGEELRLLSAEVETLTTARKLVPTAAEALQQAIEERERLVVAKTAAHRHLEIAIAHYDTICFVSQHN